MKIGIFYQQTQLSCLVPFLYLLQKYKVEHFNPNRQSLNFDRFTIETENSVFYFTPFENDLEEYEIKIGLFRIDHIDFIEKYKHKLDYFVSTRTDGECINTDFDNIRIALQHPNLIHISAHSLPEDLHNHPRVIIDFASNFFFFYFLFGFQLLNYFPTDEKKHLIGVYNMFGQTYKPERDLCIKMYSDYSYHAIFNYKNGDFLQSNSGSLLDKFSWQYGSQHITSYLDYNTAVANIIFETYGWGDTPYTIFTEKTLKAVLFHRAYIFFIYLGSANQLDWLHEKGFWFLNSLYYKENHIYSKEPKHQRFKSHLLKKYIGVKDSKVLDSGLHAVRFLSELKRKHISDKAVYQYLIDEYQDKIEANINHLQSLLSNFEGADRLRNFLKITL